MDFILGFVLLLIFQLLGEMVVILFELPVSGPVVGIVLLLTALIIKGSVGKSLNTASTTLLGHLSIMFVPVSVGLMAHYELLVNEWLPITATLILSTIIMLASTALIMAFTSKFLVKETKHDV
ncbi:CidA/LrgA family protein [Thalassotalea psychrophila]|uniref:CidA/LrgA family protein n=1 Tax=Thalassotalea psychrophila TaxID=3065647 RepID=A0ABY9TYY2_9GAMM|nr:CidA/LrgA family protein [Colwelliaceae bacterium SQ149]